MKFAIETLGCRLNMAESQSIATALLIEGHEQSPAEQAELVIINSCCVTSRSEQKSRKLLNHFLRLHKDTNVRVIFTGCAVSMERAGSFECHIANGRKAYIPEIGARFERAENILAADENKFAYVPATLSSRIRASIKIQDGCNAGCSYCVVPRTRGCEESRPLADILFDGEHIVAAGYKEIILTGANISAYNYEGAGLADVAEALLGISGDYRLHISSVSPAAVSDKLLDIMTSSRVVKHLHISLQSGSDRILAKMNRRYTSADYLRVIEKIRRRIDPINVTTDAIVGFPTETDDDFAATANIVRQAQFSKVHVFRFSKRDGTAANLMQGQVDEKKKIERAGILSEISEKQGRAWLESFNGKQSVVLSEGEAVGAARGFNEYYTSVALNEAVPAGRFCKVTTEFNGRELAAKDIELL